MSALRRISLVLALIASPDCTAIAAPVTAPAPTEESVLVRRVVWPVVVQPRRKARGQDLCDRLTPADVVVTENNEPVRVTALTRRPLVHLHALLIDTSVSMRVSDRLEHAKEAAMRYIRQLPPDEPVLVAAFDDSLTLVSPPTLDRDRLEQAVAAVRPGNWTALWDAVDELVTYLDSLPGHKTVVLLSDGEDSASLIVGGYRPVADRLAYWSNLSIFPIGLDLQAHRQAGRFRLLLRDLAATTGGLCFESQGVASIDASFRQLREHLDRRYYVTYEPLPYGAVPSKVPRGTDYELRRVEVRAERRVPCRIDSAGPPERRQHRSTRPREAVLRRNVAAADARSIHEVLGACADPAPARRAIDRLELPGRPSWPAGGEQATTFFVFDPPGPLVGLTPDVLLDRGVLYNQRLHESTGRYRASLDRAPRVGLRAVSADVPAFDRVRSGIHGPVDVLLHLLERGTCRSDGGRSPWLIHGKTFLELRELIGDALFEYYPDYREWARARLRAAAEPEIERLLAGFSSTPDMDAEQLAGIGRTLREQADRPRPGSSQQVLAEWLGDLTAGALYAELELRLTGSLLDPARRPASAELAERLGPAAWADALSWFPPATQVRVLVPLVPAYDVARDVVGFYRVVLPRPRLQNEPRDPLPGPPLGLWTVRWMRAWPAAAAELDGRVRLGGIENDVDDPRLRPLRAAGEHRRRPLRFSLVRLHADDSPGAVLELIAGFPEGEGTPAVVAVCHSGESQRLRRIERALLLRDESVATSCQDARP